MPIKTRTYLLEALDPIHVGTGGYRLGHVDNSIVREPGTNVPKIPGTTLHGAARSYAARIFGTPDAAGQNHDKVPDPDRNPICYTFGYVKTGSGQQGVLTVSDALILLFPVYSMDRGPVWVTTTTRLIQAGFQNVPAPNQNQAITIDARPAQGRIALGGLQIGATQHDQLTIPPAWANALNHIMNRIVIIDDRIFSRVINSGLEVRTSVSIDPHTGAAKDGALFTYEAIPRATFFAMDIIVDDYRNSFPGTTTTGDQSSRPLPGNGWQDAYDVFASSFNYIRMLGAGGMGTRGFGRLDLHSYVTN